MARQFGQFSLPPAASDPGSGMVEGDTYWNTTNKVVRVYTGAAWINASGVLTVMDEAGRWRSARSWTSRARALLPLTTPATTRSS